MAKIFVLGRPKHPDGKETADEIYQGLLGTGKLNKEDLKLVHYSDLLFDITTGKTSVIDSKSGEDLAKAGVALMTNWFSHASIRKDIAYSLALFFDKTGIPFFNTEALHSRSSSKLSQMVLAAQNGINVPRTIFSLDFDKLISAAESELGYPYILKDAQASRGQSNYLIKTRQAAEALKSQHTEKNPFMAQKFIDSDKTDYRFFVAGGRTRLIIKRLAQGDTHVTNTSAGAAAQLLEAGALGAETEAIVAKCAKLLHREVTGVDIIIDKSTKLPYFLEANPIPQIATGSSTQQKLAALAEALIGAANIRKD